MKKEILFGICADVHHGTRSDERWRMKRFVEEAAERKADFIIQLGDFVSADRTGREMLDVWERFDGPRYHVLGNHETEHTTKEEMLAFLGQKEKYFSFDMGAYHFVVLDNNYLKEGNVYLDYAYRTRDFNNCYIPPQELEWLEKDLQSTDKRCFLFMHATSEVGDWRILNIHAFRSVLWRVNERAGYNKVTMVFSGHDHADAYRFKGGIHYQVINSMSHKYIGPMYTDESSCSKEVEKDYGELKWIIPYREPLYAFVQLKANGLIRIIGKQTEYAGNSPLELHWEHYASPQISYREVWMNGMGEL